MKKITKIYKSALVSVALLGFTSCNYLDVVPVETADIDDILTNESSVISQLYSCYSLLQGEAAGYHTVDAVDGLGDECVLPQEWNYRSSNEQYNNITKVSHPYFMGTLGLKCFVSAHKYKKLTLT
ncbi:MAG: hypothetical protein PUG09_01295 [Prevotella sp.]|nr:hypothetical protein [Prevotella sp.]